MIPIKKPNLIIVGAGGIIGKELLTLLNETGFSDYRVRLMDTIDYRGELREYIGEPLVISELDRDIINRNDIVVLTSDKATNMSFIEPAVTAGAYVIDTSADFSHKKELPLIVAGINDHLITPDSKFIISPDAYSVMTSHIVHPLIQKFGIRRLNFTGLMGLGNEGRSAMEGLLKQSIDLINFQEVTREHFAFQVAFNSFPDTKGSKNNGYSDRESLFVNHLSRLTGKEGKIFNASMIWIPIFIGSGGVVFLEPERMINREEILDILDEWSYLRVVSAEESPENLSIQSCKDEDMISVGRINVDAENTSLQLWFAGDHIRHGICRNIYGIIKKILQLKP